ncbi:hypothetical protein J2X06_001262 [Lysobacter niastensis]|uniref:Lycopene cyclase domain-containing protein n=1 Tax=Lysobacter niastensis TaxID=380629 RepID=A0ABU1W926_9GAMM|nr:hypothetical protein [Lysobacter niastensis]MDR7134078.1 hypothetical protein [Lysobacter niastensis]
MEDYITPIELVMLLAVLWLPVFGVAALVQWRLLATRRNPIVWLGAGLLVEVAAAFCIWLSPLHRYFLSLDFLGNLAIGSIPLQAALLAAVAVTALIWAAGAPGLRLAP